MSYETIINYRKYKGFDSVLSLDEAKLKQKKWQKKGWYTRIIKCSGGYRLYVCRKEKIKNE